MYRGFDPVLRSNTAVGSSSVEIYGSLRKAFASTSGTICARHYLNPVRDAGLRCEKFERFAQPSKQGLVQDDVFCENSRSLY